MRFLVSAGPTREFLDPVRFLSNRSTGRMGFAVAEAAVEAGHEAVLVAGPVSLATPAGVRRIDVVSARDMLAALEAELPAADALVMAAAVADWRPAETAAGKLKKSSMEPCIPLVPNPDILKTLAPLKGSRVFVGFAAETGDPEAEAGRKLEGKGLDFICANDVTAPGAGFGVETNVVTILGHGGFRESLPLMAKADVGRRIVELVEETWKRWR
jgi:phosphopantothenoylcysteine decarboxylase/phosphopantothenate--cysteine ligase